MDYCFFFPLPLARFARSAFAFLYTEEKHRALLALASLRQEPSSLRGAIKAEPLIDSPFLHSAYMKTPPRLEFACRCGQMQTRSGTQSESINAGGIGRVKLSVAIPAAIARYSLPSFLFLPPRRPFFFFVYFPSHFLFVSASSRSTTDISIGRSALRHDRERSPSFRRS